MSSVDIVQKKIDDLLPKLNLAQEEMSKIMVGQKQLLHRLMVGLLGQGHVLLEGVPGLAKTTAILTLSRVCGGDFSRIQFTPDLLPSDLIGSRIFDMKKQEFFVKKGPLFGNFILADEINRSPAKVQSALLEAMQEYQVTIGDETFKLPHPFFVLATQNPIEQEGTFPLPEAQVDRFLLKVNLDYPTQEEEIEIMQRSRTKDFSKVKEILSVKDVIDAQEIASGVFVDESIQKYISDIVFASRDPEKYKIPDLKSLIAYGASPRGSINLMKAAQVVALLDGRAFVVPEDVKEIALDVLRHRILPHYEAQAEGITSDDLVKKIIDNVQVP